ncbi:MAG: diacylglycerol kinase [Devosia sp.]|nr:diacylglycerol kinase [Devosia sp.]
MTGAELAARLAERGLKAEIDDDMHKPMEGRLIRAATSAAPIVVAAGGDGTITALANAILGSDKKLGILPLGTVNALAKDLNIPLDLDLALDVLGTQACRTIDVGRVDGRVFLHKVVVGVVPELAAGREHIRGRTDLRAKLGFFLFILRRLARTKRFAVAMDLGDGQTRIERVQALAVASNAYEQGVGRIFSRQRLDEGSLYVYFLSHLNIRDFFRLCSGMVMGTWQNDSELTILKTRQVTMTTRKRAMNVMFDGEVEKLATPMTFGILPNALCVIAPAAVTPDTPAADAEEVAP